MPNNITPDPEVFFEGFESGTLIARLLNVSIWQSLPFS